jgi:hypothetical protein
VSSITAQLRVVTSPSWSSLLEDPPTILIVDGSRFNKVAVKVSQLAGDVLPLAQNDEGEIAKWDEKNTALDYLTLTIQVGAAVITK